MTGILWLAILVLFLAAWLATMNLALIECSRSAVMRRLESSGRTTAGEWLFARHKSVVLSVSLLRMAARMAFVLLMVAQFIGIGEDLTITWGNLLLVGVGALGALWLCSSVIAYALARYASVGIVVIFLPVLRVIGTVCRPVTAAVKFVDEAVRRLTGANLPEAPEQAEAELLASIQDTHRDAGLDEEAAELIGNIVEFAHADVAEVMTPRTDIEGIELTDDLAAIRAFIVSAGHSRIPVYQENLDQILGILYVKDLISFLGEDASDFKLRPLLRKPVFVPETKGVRELLGDFQRSEVHMAIVIDEYGGTEGLVTIEDVLEEIVGEIHDEHEPDTEEDPTLTEINETQAEADGRYHINDLNEQLGLSLPEDDDYDTIGGFLMAKLGHVPVVGESLEIDGVRLTAIKATPTHVRKVGIERLAPTPANGRRIGKSANGNGIGRRAGVVGPESQENQRDAS